MQQSVLYSFGAIWSPSSFEEIKRRRPYQSTNICRASTSIQKNSENSGVVRWEGEILPASHPLTQLILFRLLKVQCHVMDIFEVLKVFEFLSVLSRCALIHDSWFPRFFNIFTSCYKNNFLFYSMKLLNNFKNSYWNPPQNSLLCDRSIFSSIVP